MWFSTFRGQYLDRRRLFDAFNDTQPGFEEVLFTIPCAGRSACLYLHDAGNDLGGT